MSLASPHLAGLVLAAGASQRMGTPKATLRLEHRPLLEQHIAAFLDAGLKEVVVVVGHQAEHLARSLDLSRARVVCNQNFALGQFSSVQAGLAVLLPGLEADRFTGVLLTPVDCPPVPPRILRELSTAFLALPPPEALMPCYEGQPGHPVLLGLKAVQAALCAPPSSNLQLILESLERGVRTLAVSDPAILWNLNYPEDVARYLDSQAQHSR